MPDQLKTALQSAGVSIEVDTNLEPHIDYLYKRCSVGRNRIRQYLSNATGCGTPIIYTELYVICTTYERSPDDPERDTARALRVSVSDVKRLRRKWGVRKNKPEYNSEVTE